MQRGAVLGELEGRSRRRRLPALVGAAEPEPFAEMMGSHPTPALKHQPSVLCAQHTLAQLFHEWGRGPSRQARKHILNFLKHQMTVKWY